MWFYRFTLSYYAPVKTVNIPFETESGIFWCQFHRHRTASAGLACWERCRGRRRRALACGSCWAGCGAWICCSCALDAGQRWLLVAAGWQEVEEWRVPEGQDDAWWRTGRCRSLETSSLGLRRRPMCWFSEAQRRRLWRWRRSISACAVAAASTFHPVNAGSG